MNLNGVEYYYIRNAQGDIIGLFDKSGAQVVSYTYDTWGKLISIDGSLKDSVGVKNPYRYRGYRYDSETGLYYLQSRYYNPEWSRFINADAVAGQVGELLSHNVFAYCKNDPVNMSDKDGFRPIYTVGEETDEMMEASVAVVATAASQRKSDSNIIARTNSNNSKNKKKDSSGLGNSIATGTLLSIGEELGKKTDIVIGEVRTIERLRSSIKFNSASITIGTVGKVFKIAGILSFTQSVRDNFSGKYGISSAIGRTALDVGVFAVTTFALTSGGWAVAGAGIAISIAAEGLKYEFFDK